MDSLSTSVSTMKISAPPHELYLFKNPTKSHRHRVFPPNNHPTAATAATTKPNNLIFNKTTSFTLNYSPILPSSSTLLPNRSSSPNTHQNPATGYAAALIDVAQCKNSLQAVNRDVQSLLKFLQSEKVEAFFIDPFVAVGEKGELVKELVKRGNFDKHLVGLVKMLIDKKKKMGILEEVLVEFQRIFYQMNYENGGKLVELRRRKVINL